MMLIDPVLTPFSARVAERLGARTVITTGLALMTAGLAVLAVAPRRTGATSTSQPSRVTRARATVERRAQWKAA